MIEIRTKTGSVREETREERERERGREEARKRGREEERKRGREEESEHVYRDPTACLEPERVGDDAEAVPHLRKVQYMPANATVASRGSKALKLVAQPTSRRKIRGEHGSDSGAPAPVFQKPRDRVLYEYCTKHI
eukprot:894396-Rhodomonas_salina.1